MKQAILIKCESLAYDVLVFTESWLKPEIKNDDLLIDNFLPPFRFDRCNRPGGGVIIYVRDTLTCKRRTDLELQNLEAVWIEIVVKTKKILIGGFYRAPNSNADYFTLLDESIDRAHNTNIPDIVVTGDFNFNMHSNNNNKMKDLIQNYNLKQLIQEDTHFTENSSSLLDLILVRNSSNILTSGVVDSFIPDQIRFHCPILVILKFLHPSTKAFKRRVFNYGRANFDIFRAQLTSYELEENIANNNNINENVTYVMDTLNKASQNSIPSKVVTIRPNEHPWITCQIRNLIRKRKRTFRKYKKTQNLLFWEKFKILRNQIVSNIRSSKKNYFDKLEEILSKENVNSKIFWKTSKQVMGLQKSNHTIPTLKLNDKFAEKDIDKANMLNDYFCSQAVVNDNNKP